MRPGKYVIWRLTGAHCAPLQERLCPFGVGPFCLRFFNFLPKWYNFAEMG